MIILRERRSPKSHNGIADVLVERSPAFEEDVGHLAQILVKKANELVRRQPF